MGKPVVYKTFTFEIPCHHRLISNTLSQDENQAIFSKCMGLYGHGHNYLLKVTLRYAYDQEEPFPCEKVLDLVRSKIVDPCSYQSLNEIFTGWGIQNSITTGEQIIEVFASRLTGQEGSELLFQMELVETRKNSFYHSFQPVTPGFGNL